MENTHKYLALIIVSLSIFPASAQVVSTPCPWRPEPPRTLTELTVEPLRSAKTREKMIADGDYYIVSTMARVYLHSLPEPACRSRAYLVPGDVAEVVDAYPKKRDSPASENPWIRIMFQSPLTGRDIVGWVRRDDMCRVLPDNKMACGAEQIRAVEERQKAEVRARQEAVVKATAEADVSRTLKAAEKANEENSRSEREKASKAEAEEKGQAFAKTSPISWKVFFDRDEMSGLETAIARTSIDVGKATIDAELECKDTSLTLQLTIFDGDFPWSLAEDPFYDRSSPSFYVWAVKGRQRRNDTITERNFERDKEFNNVTSIHVGDIVDGALYGWFIGEKKFEKRALYAVMFEVHTSEGKAVIYIPPYDETLGTLISWCSNPPR